MKNTRLYSTDCRRLRQIPSTDEWHSAQRLPTVRWLPWLNSCWKSPVSSSCKAEAAACHCNMAKRWRKAQDFHCKLRHGFECSEVPAPDLCDKSHCLTDIGKIMYSEFWIYGFKSPSTYSCLSTWKRIQLYAWNRDNPSANFYKFLVAWD